MFHFFLLICYSVFTWDWLHRWTNSWSNCFIFSSLFSSDGREYSWSLLCSLTLKRSSSSYLLFRILYLWQIFWPDLMLNCFAVSTSHIALKFSNRWDTKILNNYDKKECNTRPAKSQSFVVRFTVLTWISQSNGMA